MKHQNYIDIINKMLKVDRFNHSLCVAERAVALAEKYGADKEKAYIAGLLHDITKNKSREEHLKILSEFDIILTDADKSENLLHAISGAVYVKNVLNIEDADTINAIRFHTTARANMSLLEKIIYLADFTSADRKYSDIDTMRRLADTDVDSAMMYSLSYTIKKLLSLSMPIHPDSVSAYNEIAFKQKTGEKLF